MKYPSQLPPEYVAGFQHLDPPWGPCGYLTYKRTYARLREDLGRTEEWFETAARCVNGLLHVGARLTGEEARRLYELMFTLKCCVSGRALWQLGTKTVDKLGSDSIQNCWVVAVNDSVTPFCFAFEELMLGGGVAFNIQREYVYEIPKVKFCPKVIRKEERDVDFLVPDNREGWVELLRRTLQAFFITGKSFTYSTVCVRGKGTPIKSFGGVASGPEDLCKGIEQICEILTRRFEKKLRPIDCLDVMNILGWVTVSGNVRRSAELAAGDVDDLLFLKAKDWSSGAVPNWRAMSNNTVVCNKYEYLTPKFWQGYQGTGEPYGLLNLHNCRTYGRLVDGKDYRPDKKVVGTNPCGELPLESYESCNLGEIFSPNIVDEKEFHEALGLIYKSCKTITTLPFLHTQTAQVVARNRRIGLSLSGILQASHIRSPSVLQNAYRFLEELDVKYSGELGVEESIKLTTEQPSGTKALLAGCAPGGHPFYASYYLRRIRLASNDPLVGVCRDHGLSVEPVLNFDGTHDHNTSVVAIPCKIPQGAPVAADMTAVDQLEAARHLQTWWADNSISLTAYYRKEELPEIKDWLAEKYDDCVKTASFLLHQDHGFAQAPYEEITAARYEELSRKVRPLTRVVEEAEHSLAEGVECAGGHCPVK